MAVNNPRNRYLILRLTQEEYRILREAAQDARTISEFARAKILGPLCTTHVDVQLTELRSTVARIEQLLENPRNEQLIEKPRNEQLLEKN
jgi:hypothetical protein